MFIMETLQEALYSLSRLPGRWYEDLLRATEEAPSCALEVLLELGTVALDDSIPDHELRQSIFKMSPIDDISRLVEGWGRGPIR